MDNSCECSCDCEGYWQYTVEIGDGVTGRLRRLFLCLACARHSSLLAERFRLPLTILRRRDLEPRPVSKESDRRPQRGANPFA